MPPDLSPADVAAFAAAADALLPPLPGEPGSVWASSASDLGLPGRLPHFYGRLPGDWARADLRRLLRLLRSRAGGLALYGRPKPFTALSPPEAEAALRRMATSRVAKAREAFGALRRITGTLLATAPPGEATTPYWRECGYPGPDGPPPATPKALSPVPVTAPARWTADVVVVGSGAGGGVAAAVLARAGLDVVVLERGGYANEADFSHREDEAYHELFLDGGLKSTTDGAIVMLAGATLGGGTTVNYTTSFATPGRVRDEWDRVGGFDGVFTGDDYEDASQAIHERLGINTDHSWPAPRDALMEKGLRGMGWHADAIPRNVRGCTEAACGYCTMGCRTGAKQGTLRTFLEDAAGAGARIAVRAAVDRVLVEDGRAVGVVADAGGHRLEVRAQAVVLAAGALNTPAVLLRSGIKGPAVGRHLRLHPVTVVWGRFEEPVDPWTGIMQGVYSDEFADLDGEGYGFKFETAPVHPMLPAGFFGWDGGRRYKELLLQYRHWGLAGVLLRDKGEGRVTIGRDGAPRWAYKLSEIDTRHMRVAVRRGAEAMAEAGAVEVLASTTVPVSWAPRSSGSLESFLAGVDAIGYGPHQTAYLSFHQMGSARMGADPSQSVVGADNQAHDVAGLYVMDASCFPTASGVNPMISIETIAWRGARMLAESLG